MILKVQNAELEGVKIITPNTVFEDYRGDYVEIYNQKLYKESGIDTDFVQDDYATSSKGVLRGIHGDAKTAKLIKCIYGSLYFVAVNNVIESLQYKKWMAVNLTSQNRTQVYVPAQFGIGYLVMSDLAIFHYKQSTYYHECQQFTIKWNDPEFNIHWPHSNPITSLRDRNDETVNSTK